MSNQTDSESTALKYVSGLMSKEDYLAACLAQTHLSEQCKGLEGCEAFLKSKLRDGFWALDKLDRSDELWRQTNKLPTLHKLSGYALHQIKAKVNPADAAWLAIACALLHGSQHLEVEPWRILKENDGLDVTFLVRTAWNMSPYWGDENVVMLAALARDLNLEAAVEHELDKLSQSGSREREWAQGVRLELRRG